VHVPKKRKDHYLKLRRKGVPSSSAVVLKELEQVWEPSRSIIENHLKLGIATDANEQEKKAANFKKNVLIDPNITANATHVTFKNLVHGPRQLRTSSNLMRIYLVPLMKRHGTNVEAMAADIRLNYRQFTAVQLGHQLKLLSSSIQNSPYVASQLQVTQDSFTKKKRRNKNKKNKNKKNNNKEDENNNQ